MQATGVKAGLTNASRAAEAAAAADEKPATRAQLRVFSALERKIDPRDPAVVNEAAATLLSELFFAPLLAEMRKFPFGRDLAVGGQTEAIFGAQLDQRVADTVAASSSGLTRQVVRELQPPGGDRATWWQNPARGAAGTDAQGES